MHSFSILHRKSEGAAIIPTQKSATAKDINECVGFGAKRTLTTDEEDEKSISKHREDAKKPAENPKPRFH